MKNRRLLGSLGSLTATLSLVAFSSLDCSHAVASAAGGDPGSSTATGTVNPNVNVAAAGGAGRAPDVYRVPIAGLPSIGNPDALVTIVEFTDYECPYCQRAEQTIARLRARPTATQ